MSINVFTDDAHEYAKAIFISVDNIGLSVMHFYRHFNFQNKKDYSVFLLELLEIKKKLSFSKDLFCEIKTTRYIISRF